MGSDFWRGLQSGLQQVPGRLENVAGLGLDALTTLNAAASHDPTALLRLQLLQSQAAQDPGVRSQLGSGGSPFFSGLLGYPVHSQPAPLPDYGSDPRFNTALSPAEEQAFAQWKAQYAPHDSGQDYDLRGAFKAGLTPDPMTGHFPDTFKKPSHPTFSIESKYAALAPQRAGRWQGGQFIPPQPAAPLPTVLAPRLPPLSPATQADRALQAAEADLIQQNPQAAARAALRIPQPLPDLPAGTDLRLQRITPAGPTYGVLPPPQPLTQTNIPGLLRDPTSNRVIREPTPRTEAAGRDYLTQSRMLDPRRLEAIAAGAIKDPKLSAAQAQQLLQANTEHKAAAAAERERRVQLIKQVVLTSPTRTMIETAPGVLKLADRVAQDMLRVQTGPFAGRWQELWAGRVGLADPDFIRLRGDVTLLRRLLARMHIGARSGGREIVQEFERVLGEANQAPENLQQGIQTIRDYAGDLLARKEEALRELRGAGAPAPQGNPTAATAPETIPGVRFHGVVGP